VPRRDPEAGFSLVALIATMTIMLIVIQAATPYWKYVMQDMREEELFFRGDSIASAIERYQKKNGGALPTSLDVLVKGKYLRKAYTEPMVKHGKWRFIRQGEVVPPGATGARGAPSGPSPFRPLGEPETQPGAAPSPPPQTLGPFIGVVSTSKEKSLRLMNGREHYNEWLFIAGQQRLLGRQDMAIKPGALPGSTGSRPGAGPPGSFPGGTPPVKQ